MFTDEQKHVIKIVPIDSLVTAIFEISNEVFASDVKTLDREEGRDSVIIYLDSVLGEPAKVKLSSILLSGDVVLSCKWCGEPANMSGTQECNRCWKLRRKIEMEIFMAEQKIPTNWTGPLIKIP
jgi:hypothetical protein